MRKQFSPNEKAINFLLKRNQFSTCMTIDEPLTSFSLTEQEFNWQSCHMKPSRHMHWLIVSLSQCKDRITHSTSEKIVNSYRQLPFLVIVFSQREHNFLPVLTQFSPSENTIFSVRTHFSTSNKTIFSKWEHNLLYYVFSQWEKKHFAHWDLTGRKI